MVAQLSRAASGGIFSRLVPFFFAFVVLVSLLLEATGNQRDPYRCRALLDEGSWQDSPNSKGSRAPYVNWQPTGCVMRKYTRADIHRCVDGRPMVFSGDSTTSQVFWAIAHILEKRKVEAMLPAVAFDQDVDQIFDSLRLIKIWNPTMATDANSNLTAKLKTLRDERNRDLPTRKQKSAALTVIGGGSWFAANTSQEPSLEPYTRAVDSLAKLLLDPDQLRLGKDPMDSVDGVGNQVFIAPVPQPFLGPGAEIGDGGKEAGLLRGEVEALNLHLAKVQDKYQFNVPWAFHALSKDQRSTVADRDGEGIHVVDAVAEAKAHIILNARCNARLDAMSDARSDYNCCSAYGETVVMTKILLWALTGFTILCFVADLWRLRSKQVQAGPRFLSMSTGIFAVALILCYLADRTQLLTKGNKYFAVTDVWGLLVIAAVAGVVTLGDMAQSRPALSGIIQPSLAVQDQPLSRAVMEEWKGWMQLLVLIYRWTGASDSPGSYVGTQLLLAAYLFQTGYGHTMYLLTTKDYSIKRFVSVGLRLNMLTLVLPYLMQTDYMFYIVPAVFSFWFVVIFIVLAVKPNYNEHVMGFSVKIGVSLLVVSLFGLVRPLRHFVHTILQLISQIDWIDPAWLPNIVWNASPVYAGVVLAFVLHNGILNPAWMKSLALAGVGITSLVAFAIFSLATHNPSAYAPWHPVLCLLPILGYIAMRNVTTYGRNRFSRGFAWVGRHTLEIFVLSHHLFLAADGKGVLLLGIFSGDKSLAWDRWRDVAVLLVMLLWLSSQVHEATRIVAECVTAQNEDYVYEELDKGKAGLAPLPTRPTRRLLEKAKRMAKAKGRQLVTVKFWQNNLGVRLLGMIVFLGVVNRLCR